MRRLLTCGVAVLLMQNVFGQGRMCDISANIFSHSNGHKFISRSKEVVKVSLINLGPDSLRTGDNYSVKFVFGGGNIFPKFKKVNRLVVPGDSIIFIDTLDINYVGDIDSFDFCTDVLVYNGGRDSIKLEVADGLLNNRYCITAAHKRVTTSTSRTMNYDSLFVYPNPVKDNLVQFVHLEHYSRLELYNSSAQLVKKLRVLPGVEEISWDVKDLRPGLYFLRAYNTSGVSSRKIIIQ
mgnify:CR=1 FL=1